MKPFYVDSIASNQRCVLAVLKRDVAGKFTRWEKGTVVRALCLRGSRYCIERIRWRKPYLPLMNGLAGVPRSALQIEPGRVVLTQ